MLGAMTCINFDFEDDWIFDSYEHHLRGDASKFSSPESYDGHNAIIMANNIIHPVEKEASVIFISQGVVIDDLSGDKVEQVSVLTKSVLTTTMPTSSNAPPVFESSSSSLVGEQCERGAKFLL